MDIIPWYATTIRLIVPFTILRFPLFGIFACMLVDAVDWKFINVISASDSVSYQSWDKMMDLYYWFFILWMIKSWKYVWAKRIATLLFGYRLVGMILFWITDWRPILFFFPNVFENFVILCLVMFHFNKDMELKLMAKLNLNLLQKTVMLGILIVPKLIHEFFQHFLLKQPWETIDIGKWLGFSEPVKEHINYISWGSILYATPMLGFLTYILKKRVSKN